MFKKVSLFVLILILSFYLFCCLPFVSADIEDYTGWNEVDSSGILTVSSDSIVSENCQIHDDAYVYQEVNVGTSYTHYLAWQSHGMEASGWNFVALYSTWEDGAIGSLQDCYDMGAHGVVLGVYVDSSPTYDLRFQFQEKQGSSTLDGGYFNYPSDNVWYYAKVVRSDTSITAYLYTGSDYSTGLINSITMSLSSNEDFGVVYTFQSRGHSSSSGEGDYSVKDHDFGWSSPDSFPQYSSFSDDGVTRVGAEVEISCYWQDDYDLDTVYLEHNASESFTNVSISVSGTAQWCNESITLHFTTGVVIAYRQHCMDNASNWNTTEWAYITTTSMSMVFRFNDDDAGDFYVDGTEIVANGTVRYFDYNQSVTLMAFISNASYAFVSFNWTLSSSEVNPENMYCLTDVDTVWCIFGEGSTGDVSQEDYDDMYLLAGFLVVIVLLGFAIIFINGKDNRGGIL